MIRILFLLVAILTATVFPVQADDSFGKKHALTIFGEPKYGPDFDHFEWANPNAPKGGRINLDYWMVFDTLQPFLFKGVKAPGMNNTSPTMLVRYFQPLMIRSYDEPLTYYGLVAETAEVAKDYSWVEFTIRKEARFHDDSSITADDVVFTFNALITKGDPAYKVAFEPVEKVVKTGQRTVRFIFKIKNNRQMPTLVADLPVLSKKYYMTHEFDKTTLEPPMGSGPYKIESVDAGRTITYRRWDNYWGKDLAVNKGLYNFDVVHYQAFRDSTVALEAIKSGITDLREESSSRNWAQAYKTPAVDRGDLIKEYIPRKLPAGNQSMFFNLMRYPDRRVREAIAQTFDFDWINASIMYNSYARNHSYFTNTEFAQKGKPSAEELKLLEPYRDILDPRLFEQEFRSPSFKQKGALRQNLIHAQKLLNDAGYVLKDGVRVNKKTGEPLTLTFILYESGFERLLNPMVGNLKKLGIPAQIRNMEVAQWQRRIDHKDFDIFLVYHSYFNSYYPGAEQRNYWHSAQAEVVGSLNYVQLKNPAVDAMIEKIGNAETLPKLRAAARALDRVLLWEYVGIPSYHVEGHRLAYWNKFEKPATAPLYPLEDNGLQSWWAKPEYRKAGGK